MTETARRWPRRRTARARLTIVYTSLYLAAGSVLLAAVYTLVAHTETTVTGFVPDATFLAQCKQTLSRSNTKPGATNLSPPSPNLALKCKKAFQAGELLGVKNQHAQTVHHLLFYGIVALVVTTALAAVLGWLVAGRILRPVHAITATARRASETHLGERIALRGPNDELRELADTFDSMLDRLDAAFTSQKRFVANASHELRTPLAVMRTAIDVTLAKTDPSPAQLTTMAHDVREACTTSEKLIEALLTLARSDRGPAVTDHVDLAVCVEDALEASTNEIVNRGLTIETELRPAPVRGDTVLIQRMIANLIDNAIRHNVDGGHLHVATTADQDDCKVNVRNTWEPVTIETIGDLFEPFRRHDERSHTNDGVGLGLSIVRSVVLAHAGTVHATIDETGDFTVSVRLPAEHIESTDPTPT